MRTVGIWMKSRSRNRSSYFSPRVVTMDQESNSTCFLPRYGFLLSRWLWAAGGVRIVHVWQQLKSGRGACVWFNVLPLQSAHIIYICMLKYAYMSEKGTPLLLFLKLGSHGCTVVWLHRDCICVLHALPIDFY